MRRKQILIGLFAFIIYRTIGEPKKPQGGRERAFVDTCFLRPATAGTGILNNFFLGCLKRRQYGQKKFL